MSKKKKGLPDKRLRIENFYKRWNIDLPDSERWGNFKNRVLNSYSDRLGTTFLHNSRCEDEFSKLIGLHATQVKGIFDMGITINATLNDSPTYRYFLGEVDIKKFILGLEVLFWMETIEWDYKSNLLVDIKDAIIITAVPLEVANKDNEVLFYPAGAKLLDEKLVNDNLDWLASYPKSYETFKLSLSEIGVKGKERHVIDNLRLSLELLLRGLLNNEKSLENQNAVLGSYLKGKGTSVQISNLFRVVLDYFNKFQNDNIKHQNNAQSDEVEFILYLTGTLMRFLLTK